MVAMLLHLYRGLLYVLSLWESISWLVLASWACLLALGDAPDALLAVAFASSVDFVLVDLFGWSWVWNVGIQPLAVRICAVDRKCQFCLIGLVDDLRTLPHHAVVKGH